MDTRTSGHVISRGFRGATLYLVTMSRATKYWHWSADRTAALRFETHAAALAAADRAAREYGAACAVVDPAGNIAEPAAARVVPDGVKTVARRMLADVEREQPTLPRPLAIAWAMDGIDEYFQLNVQQSELVREYLTALPQE